MEREGRGRGELARCGRRRIKRSRKMSTMRSRIQVWEVVLCIMSILRMIWSRTSGEQVHCTTKDTRCPPKKAKSRKSTIQLQEKVSRNTTRDEPSMNDAKPKRSASASNEHRSRPTASFHLLVPKHGLEIRRAKQEQKLKPPRKPRTQRRIVRQSNLTATMPLKLNHHPLSIPTPNPQ